MRQTINFDRYVGLPWRAGGRDRAGVDCWGLVWLFYREQLGLEIPSYGGAYDSGCDAAECGGLIAQNVPLDWREAKGFTPGAVAVINRLGQPCHVGIVAPGRRLLHIESAAQLSAIVPIGGSIRRRLVGCYNWSRA